MTRSLATLTLILFLSGSMHAGSLLDLTLAERRERISRYGGGMQSGPLICLRTRMTNTLTAISTITSILGRVVPYGQLIFGPTSAATGGFLAIAGAIGAVESVCECEEDTTAPPQEWDNYDEYLRSLREAGDGGIPLPVQPKYPIRCVNKGIAKFRISDCAYKIVKQHCR